MTIIALILGVVSGFIGTKVDSWTTLKRLGLASECPALFLGTEGICHLVMWTLFLAAVVALFLTNLAWWMCAVIALAAITLALFVGHCIALRKYRSIIRNRMEREKNEAIRRKYSDELAMSGSELLKRRAQ